MHLGRCYPRSVYKDFYIGLDYVGFDYPPRKVFFEQRGGFPSGTLAVIWQDVEVLSTIGERLDDGPSVYWKIEHPTVSDSWIDFYWGMLLDQAPPGQPNWVTWRYDIFFSSVKYGTCFFNHVQPDIQCGAFFPGLMDSATHTWTDLLDPPAFTNLNTFYLYAATWARDTYQPYKTRP